MPWTIVPESQFEKTRLFSNEFGRYAVRAFSRTDYAYVFIDEESYHFLKDYRWYLTKRGKRGNIYLAVTEQKSKQIYMQALIYNHYFPVNPGAFIQHIDGDKLNNERKNLVATTRGCPDRAMRYRDVLHLHASDTQERR